MEEVLSCKLVPDSIILFDSIPITIINDRKEPIEIWGITYSRGIRHHKGTFIHDIEYYLSYLRGCEIIQTKGGDVSKNQWTLSTGDHINLTQSRKELIHRLLKDKILWYRLVEYPLSLDIREGEVDGNFLISTKPLERMGTDYGRHTKEKGDENEKLETDMKNRKEEKE